MATTSTIAGGTSGVAAQARADYSGDAQGSIGPVGPAFTKTWNAASGDAPTYTGWLYGTVVVPAAGLTVLLASLTDPFGTGGDSTAEPRGFTPVGAKVKELFIRNKSLTIALTVIRPANGLPLFLTSGDGVTLAACDTLYRYMETGLAALSAGVNDALLLTAASATVDVEFFCRFGI